jgi:hypothetical protein
MTRTRLSIQRKTVAITHYEASSLLRADILSQNTAAASSDEEEDFTQI